MSRRMEMLKTMNITQREKNLSGGRGMRHRLLLAAMLLGCGGLAILLAPASHADVLSDAAIWSYAGGSASANLGQAVAPAGDVNGDGYSDVLVGCPGATNGQFGEGCALLFLGRDSGLEPSPVWSYEPNLIGASFGAAVAPAGDVNGDGLGDVIIGAFGLNNGHSGEGAAYLFLGTPLGLTLAPVWIAEGNQTSAAFGSSVATAGDVNGDGYDDVLVGARRYDRGQTDEGACFLYLGSADGLMTSPAWTGDGNETSAYFGTSVSSAGDVNADGYADVIVGAPNHALMGLPVGRASVYLGGPAGLSPSPVWSAAGSIGSNFGKEVSLAGDIDGDGYGDVLVVAPNYSGGQENEGRVCAFRGTPTGVAGTADWTYEPNVANRNLGHVATAGDVDGDGFADIILGSEWASDYGPFRGSALLFRGSESGLADAPVATRFGDQDEGRFGTAVSAAGDVNGDGFGDLLVGAPYADATLQDTGRAFLYTGNGDIPEPYPSSSREPNEPLAEFGRSMAAGDWNGDGTSDLAVGARGYSNGQTYEGAVFTYYGSHDGLSQSFDSIIDIDQEQARFGSSVARAGDVDGDGYEDLIVGAPMWSGTLLFEGRALLFQGSAAGLFNAPSWSATAGTAYGDFGSAVAGAGDVNGDGYADVLVAAAGRDQTYEEEGLVRLYLGSPSGLGATPAWTRYGGRTGARFGSSVASAGDVNADGYSDVIVGGAGWSNGNALEGAAWIFLGGPSGLATTPAWSDEGNLDSAAYGAAVSSAGDINGDGFGDFLVGAPRDNSIQGLWAGAFHYYYGNAQGVAFQGGIVQGDAHGARMGEAVAPAGDVNGDGLADFVVGLPGFEEGQNEEGVARLYCGSPGGPVRIFSWAPRGEQVGANMGAGFAGPADFEGDGFCDIAAGAPGATGSEPNEGRAYFFRGDRGAGRDRATRQLQFNGSTPIAPLGKSDQAASFTLSILARSGQGRARVRVEYEAKPLLVPFESADIERTGAADLGAPTPGRGSGLEVQQVVGGLDPATAYRWRARVTTTSPYFPRTKWLSLTDTDPGGMKLRTAAGTVSAPDPAGSTAAGLRFACAGPNPFRERALFTYTLPGAGAGARLSIFDCRGRRVRMLAIASEGESAGSLIWDGRTESGDAAPAGVYFARLEAGAACNTLRLVRLR